MGPIDFFALTCMDGGQGDFNIDMLLVAIDDTSYTGHWWPWPTVSAAIMAGAYHYPTYELVY